MSFMKFKKFKKITFGILFLLLGINVFADIPDSLYGIWEGKDRYVFFERVSSLEDEIQGEDRIVIILKDYYGWYLDRVVEHEDYSNEYKRDRNNATTKNPVFVQVDAKKLTENAMELKLQYDKHDITYVPLAVIDDKMFLEFWIQDENHPGFWLGNVVTDGIKVSNQTEKENLWSWFIDPEENDIYKLRFWKTPMDFDPELEGILKSQRIKDTEYKIQKHIFSAENVYACVPGRRVYIRNLDKQPVSQAFDGKDMIFDQEKNVAAVNNVYLKRLVDKETFSDLMEIVRIQNSKRKPAPPPPFPPEDLDYHWDLIDMLEKDNAIIQKVRQRQREFGLRGKDINR